MIFKVNYFNIGSHIDRKKGFRRFSDRQSFAPFEVLKFVELVPFPLRMVLNNERKELEKVKVGNYRG